MKMGIKEMNFIHSLVGKRLLNVCCAAEILTFDFFPLALHASGYARIIKNSDILVTTLDYQSWIYQKAQTMMSGSMSNNSMQK